MGAGRLSLPLIVEAIAPLVREELHQRPDLFGQAAVGGEEGEGGQKDLVQQSEGG